MAQYRIHDPEERLECPYNPVHMVPAKRFQYHLVNCRKNYIGTEFATCPFNATHQMPKPKLRHHLTNCPDKALVESELSYASRKENGKVSMLKGCTDTPLYKDVDIPTHEDWDAEITAPVRVGPQYDSTYYDRVQFNDLSGEELYNELPSGNAAFGAEEDTLRLPKTTSEAAMTGRKPQAQPIQQPVSSVFAYSFGRGRGRGIAASSNNNAATNGQTPGGMNAEGFVPMMPYGRGMGMGNQPAGAVGIGRGMVAGAAGQDQVTPPPGFCVPKVCTNNSPGTDFNY